MTMTHDEQWLRFIVSNKRNPSEHRIEEHLMLNFIKHNRKLLNAGKMKDDRVEMLTIVDFLRDSAKLKRVLLCAHYFVSLRSRWQSARNMNVRISTTLVPWITHLD